MGSSARLTEAAPTEIPALVNSVICCGSRVPSGLLLRSYHPHPSVSPKPFENPMMLVEAARSAEQARKSGRPYSFLAKELIQEPQAARAARFGWESPGR